ncbi:MAG: hypothetical protein KC560_09460 [Myxococcales bacterium]|nr:hypothetical protein [Myxococcales bacterium]
MTRGRPALSTATKIFAIAWIVYTLHFATDIVREHYPAFALAERGTLRVDPYLGLHPDLFEMEGRGAFINNNPGASLVGAVPYAVVRPLVDRVVEPIVARRANAEPPAFDDPRPNRRAFFEKTFRRGLDVRFGLAAGAIQALGFAPLAAAMVVVLHGLLLRMGFARRASAELALLYAFATPLFFRAAFLNHNLLVAHATLACFALLWSDGGITTRPARLALAGFATGFGLLCDYAGAVPVVVLGLYALERLVRALPLPSALARMAAMVGGACVPVGALLAYQAWAFGNPFLPAQHYMPATQYSGEGWNGFDWPALDLLAENLFDRRFGLFAFGPLLLLAFARPLVRRARVRRPEIALAYGLFVALLVFTSANQFARLQWNTGFRMLAPVVPLLFVALADVWVALPRRVALALGALATAHAWCIAMVRADALASVETVLRDGPRLPWLTSIWRAGGTYLPLPAGVEAGPALLALPFLALGAALVALVATRATRDDAMPRVAPAAAALAAGTDDRSR